MTIQNMKKTMEQMIQQEGYYVKVAIRQAGYYVSTDAVKHADGITLYYINSHTPGEVVFMVKTFFDKLNGK